MAATPLKGSQSLSQSDKHQECKSTWQPSTPSPGCWSAFNGAASQVCFIQTRNKQCKAAPMANPAAQSKIAAADLGLLLWSTLFRVTASRRPFVFVLLQFMGGRFRSVMPSDLFKPGAMARESLRAPGRDYASSVNREELQRLMRRSALHAANAEYLATHTIFCVHYLYTLYTALCTLLHVLYSTEVRLQLQPCQISVTEGTCKELHADCAHNLRKQKPVPQLVLHRFLTQQQQRHQPCLPQAHIDPLLCMERAWAASLVNVPMMITHLSFCDCIATGRNR